MSDVIGNTGEVVKSTRVRLSGSPELEQQEGRVTTTSLSNGPAWISELYDAKPMRVVVGSFGLRKVAPISARQEPRR